ncbi:MAG TPA: hypothetical protein VLG27_02960 [Candidatus Saccharimonadia bacterium]|nr:hypothetical protein [Candidatus Saccharimonadia bacterium]
MGTSKQAKLPPIGPATKLLSFDVETNGLHGDAFAVGAVVIGADNKTYSEFSGRCPTEGKIDEWVDANVLPAITDIPTNFGSSHELREAFWEWYLEAEQQADYVLVSNGYPVEYRFLLKCQEENLAERYWQHPFPILDLTSLLLGTGQDTSSKSQLINRIIEDNDFKRHHPLHDAKIAALVAFDALAQNHRADG